jgi:hypothetical protein
MSPRNTPEIITELRANEVIVVGTNLRGNHAGGLAFEASLKWGLLEGYFYGLIGKCYGFPTLDEHMRQLPIGTLELQADEFFACARANPDLTFLLTKVGCGIAGFAESEIAPLFAIVPTNVIKPLGW